MVLRRGTVVTCHTRHGYLRLKIKPYNPKSDEWDVYEEKLHFYMDANGITDAKKKRSILLTVCGDSTFKLLRSLVPGGKMDAEDVTFDSLLKLLKSHYAKKQSVVVHRFYFNTRSRKPAETIADYVAALRELALHCNYGATERLEEMLRDRLICGVNHSGIQRKLLSEGDITYTQAFTFAQSIETAERDAKKLGSSGDAVTTPPDTSIHHTRNPPRTPSSTLSCYRCGSPHLATQCRHKDTVCWFCKKRGHIEKVCKTKERQESASKVSTQSTAHPRRQNRVQEHPATQESLSDTEYGLNVVINEHSDPYLVDVHVNDIPVKMELDTGAAVSVINSGTFDLVKQTHPELTLLQAESNLKTYTGQDIQVLGVAPLNIRYKEKHVCLSIHVVCGAGPNLLGRDLITALEVNLQDLKQIRSLDLSSPLHTLLDKHSTLFSNELGCFNGPPVTLTVKEDIAPKFYKARPVPFALRDKVEKELQDLQDKGIISPVQHSAWAAPVVSVLKKSALMW